MTWCLISLLFSNGMENMSKYKKMSFVLTVLFNYKCHSYQLRGLGLIGMFYFFLKLVVPSFFKSDHPVASRFCSLATFCSSLPCIPVLWWFQLLQDCLSISQMLCVPSYFPVSLLCVYPGAVLRYISATSVLNSSPSRTMGNVEVR